MLIYVVMGVRFRVSGLARGVSRSASAYDFTRSELELEFLARRCLESECASARGSGRADCASGLVGPYRRTARARDSARSEIEFSKIKTRTRARFL